MKIACCTIEMITLIFLLFVSINGAYTHVSPPTENLVSRPATELAAAWGEPETVADATEMGFRSSQLAGVEVWTYGNPARSVLVRDDVVVSIRYG